MQIKNVRFIMVAITTLSAYAVYVSRVNLSITIIAMVDDEARLAASTGVASARNQREASTYETDTESTDVDRGSQRALSQSLNNSTLWDSNSTSVGANSTLPSNQKTARPMRGPFSTPFASSNASLFHKPLISQDKFDWSSTEQGHILGAFFYGYIIFQIPGARIAELVGARWIMMVATAGSALVSFIFPLSTQLNSIYLLMVLRFVMGLCQSAFFPAAYVFFCRWLPENERSVLLPIMFMGSNVGSISTYTMSSYLISASYGWPSVFYLSGFINLFVTILWIVFGSNGPQDNWLITREECQFIQSSMMTSTAQNSINNSLSDKSTAGASAKSSASDRDVTIKMNNLSSKLPQGLSVAKLLPPKTHISRGQHLNLPHPLAKSRSANDLLPCLVDLNNNVALEERTRHGGPTSEAAMALVVDRQQQPQQQQRELSWLKLITSRPIWVFVLSMYGNEWSQVVITYELPTYLNKALNFPIEQNGVINSFFQLSYTLASPIMSALGAYMLDRHLLKMRKIHVRKLFQSLATFGQLACFLSVPICGANRGLIIMFMFSAVVFKSCANAGDIMVSGDLSPDYAGTIFAFANSIGNTAGVLVPLLAGLIVHDQNQRQEWTPFWLTSASIMGFSGLIFLILGETNQQNFSSDDKKPKQEL